MIQELFDFITQRWDFLLPLIYEHLQISAIAIVFATIVGVSIGILIAEKRKASSLTHLESSASCIRFLPFPCWAF